jgi:group I intron endonuclease
MEIYMDSGIYKIYCKTTGKFYIGSSQEISRRRIHHYNRLRANKHGNPHLQNSYNLYGEADIVFEVLEYCDVPLLLETEQRHIDAYKGKGVLFNVAEVAGASMRNKRHSSATIQKMKKVNGQAWKGKHLPEEHRKKISEKRIKLTRERGLRKLTDEQVREVRKLKAAGIGDRKVADMFNVSRKVIISIRKGTRYFDVI